MIKVWTDGCCEPINPGGTACAGYVIKKNGTKIAEGSHVIGKGEGMTNNVAEYYALIYALKRIIQLKLENEDIVVKSDSQLLVNQVNRKWNVKAFHLRPLIREVWTLATKMRLKIEWVPREENEEADHLANSAYKKYPQDTKDIKPVFKKTTKGLDSYF